MRLCVQLYRVCSRSGREDIELFYGVTCRVSISPLVAASFSVERGPRTSLLTLPATSRRTLGWT